MNLKVRLALQTLIKTAVEEFDYKKDIGLRPLLYDSKNLTLSFPISGTNPLQGLKSVPSMGNDNRVLRTHSSFFKTFLTKQELPGGTYSGGPVAPAR
jgi:hypothetical protein